MQTEADCSQWEAWPFLGPVTSLGPVEGGDTIFTGESLQQADLTDNLNSDWRIRMEGLFVPRELLCQQLPLLAKCQGRPAVWRTFY